MKTTRKYLCLLLMVSTLLWGCGEPAPAETTQVLTETTETTMEPTTEATLPPVTSEDALQQAMENSLWVTMEGDIGLTEEIVVKGHTLNGGGYTLTGIPYVENDPATENAVVLTSGSVENVRIIGAYRCLGDTEENAVAKDISISNVYADGTLYALNFGYGSRGDFLYVENSTLLGWTNFHRLESAEFVNCTFGWNSAGNGGHFRAYVSARLVGCRFEGKTDKNGNYVPYNIDFSSSYSGIKLYLEDCYVGDTLITQENLTRLLKVSAHGNEVIVRNTN